MAGYTGFDAMTGRRIDDMDHVRQSIRKILTTPIGSRVMRRDFGSLIPDLIDQPMNGRTRMLLMSASVMAIARWETRVSLTGVMVDIDADGRVVADIDLSLRGRADNERITMMLR
ncbi:MAG: GPW/gp25 family protein [Laribacter sp.]|nr:GPW/gp25 family protein [Laribacter sp.]